MAAGLLYPRPPRVRAQDMTVAKAVAKTSLVSSSPEGAGILAVSRGDDPFAITTQIRTLWR